ncbi:DsbA family protein [Silvimonas soli]|uniref:DsbA family protein n=1 Tax=Silvimonas soli TaxID=2980100 RepID=UPI0024B36A64|nr:DsbA family protein [Silvimonas soli]
MTQPTLTLLFDPLCGWCYAAQPGLDALAQNLDVQWHLLPTGLFAGDGGQTMTTTKREYFWSNDQRIEQLTGQVFSQAYYDDVLSDFTSRFDSWLPTKAWYLITEQQPAAGLEVLHAIQQLRYVAGRQSADIEALADVAEKYGLERESFLISLQGPTPPALTEAISQARQLMQSHRVGGVPTLLLETASGSGIVPNHMLYHEPTQLIGAIQSALQNDHQSAQNNP